MRVTDIPTEALSAQPTHVPQRTVYDWDGLLKTMQAQGYAVIETDEIRRMPSGGEVAVIVKSFSDHLRQIKKLRLRTKRISKTRWYCTIQGETDVSNHQHA
jgi:hypothetical protein